jgi:hypothetical protein
MPRGKSKEELAKISAGTRFNGRSAVEAGRKGNETRKNQRAWRDAFKERMTQERMEKIFDALCEKAECGDVQAASFLRDTMGEKPKEQIEQTINEIAFRIEGVSEEDADAISG